MRLSFAEILVIGWVIIGFLMWARYKNLRKK